ncbi:sensor histidine kinase [Clostridium oryzae]|uniref:histidine kinase n=1 Tax=Clostridium oryzae TaxID=1450648 RepID=A0A1V4IEQ0_9CLOT|nr:HAMP domain-containing sensor histidine kinase [Clostridium oryzae]OPJ58125.1 signal transduction histidine-protein kinase ArlS [Clostridium oryzae]
MKLAQKIFLYPMFIFLLVFNIANSFILENNFNTNLTREVNRGLKEHLSTYFSIETIITSYRIENKTKSTLNSELKNLILNYLSNLNDKFTFIELIDNNGKKIFTNFKFKISDKRIEIKKLKKLNQKNYMIRDINKRTYLFVSNLFYVDNVYYKFSYVRDITYVYKDRTDQYAFYIKIEIVVAIILAIYMYIFSRHIIRPINKLIGFSKVIASGRYTERAEVKSNDEIETLSNNFNIMAAAIEEKVGELEKKAEERQMFISNLTHEIKTPLTSIIGYADFLRSTKYNENTFLKALNYIYKEGKRLESISQNMMNLIRLKKEAFIMKDESIKNIMVDVRSIVKEKLERKNIRLVENLFDFSINAEKNLIISLMVNFVDNAIKSSEGGSTIYISSYILEENKIVEVADNGIGIAEENLNKVFDAFYMVDKSRSRKNNGIGLGLTICKEIADIHNAKLEIHSKIKEGTCIKIIF